jgi:hypothetical protein
MKLTIVAVVAVTLLVSLAVRSATRGATPEAPPANPAEVAVLDGIDGRLHARVAHLAHR